MNVIQTARNLRISYCLGSAPSSVVPHRRLNNFRQIHISRSIPRHFLSFNHIGSSRGLLQVRMVLTESRDLAIGTVAPDFKLLEPLTGKEWSLANFQGSPLLVMFICNHCPFVVLLKEAIAALAREYQAKGFGVVAISSNSIITHPQDGPEKMAEDATKFGYTFPYLYDSTQEVAKDYRAACTPEFYVFDDALKLQYHGQFDDARPNSGKPVTGKDLRKAMDEVLNGQPITWPTYKSIGCNIKWAPGNEPW
eukprot:jgi/Botrbrau1/4499/Bobra.0220s0032.1